jgi:hypothetical protein
MGITVDSQISGDLLGRIVEQSGMDEAWSVEL